MTLPSVFIYTVEESRKDREQWSYFATLEDNPPHLMPLTDQCGWHFLTGPTSESDTSKRQAEEAARELFGNQITTVWRGIAP